MKKVILIAAVCTSLILTSWTLAEGATYSQLALGGGYDCVLIVTNQSDLIWQGRALLRTGDNQPWPASWRLNGVEEFGTPFFQINLSAKGTAKYVLSGDAMARAGYLVLESVGASLESQIVVFFFYNFRDEGGQLQDSTATMAGPPSQRFLFPVERSAQVDTGFAYAPDETRVPFNIVMTLRDLDGSDVDRVTLTYEGHLARFFSQVFEEVPKNFLGAVLVEAAQKIHLTVLRMEFSEPRAFQLTSVLPETLPDVVESDEIALLDFRVQDAEYSKRLDRIIMVASDQNQLHIYDPVTKVDTAVDLPQVGSSVSVSPDGAYATVGHNAWISYVNLETATLERTLPVSTDVLDIVLAGNGWAYVFPRRDQWENIYCINIATAEQTQSAGRSIYAGTLAKLHPGGTAIYGADNGLSPSDIEKYDISDGTAQYLYDSSYHGDHAHISRKTTD